MDALETKLDLAKAYIEMGDAEAARDITEEVLKNGTAEQKKTAETILERLK
jgi:pilus assembly protein FimV